MIDDYVYPEFEQNWKLFAPNPLQQNIAVQARAEIANDDGTAKTTGWFDLSAQDGEAIDHNLAPQPHPAERTAPGLGLLHRIARQQGQAHRPAG